VASEAGFPWGPSASAEHGREWIEIEPDHPVNPWEDEGVKAGRKLGHSRRSKTRPLEGWVGGATVVAKAEPVGRGLSGDGRLSPSARGSADFGGFRADSGVEVLASESVAVAFEREDL
jgi:hypothetical protein